MEHQLEAISVRPVTVKEVKGDEIVLQGQKVPEMVGCRVCGMDISEAVDTPCPGRKVKDIIAELTEGLEFPE